MTSMTNRANCALDFVTQSSVIVLRKITLSYNAITFFIYSANTKRKLTPEELLNILKKKKVSTRFAKYCIKITDLTSLHIVGYSTITRKHNIYISAFLLKH